MKEVLKLNWNLLQKTLLVICFGGSSLLMSAQTKTVTGVVADAAGEALTGVSISVKGTLTGTVSDIDGRYSIAAPDKEAVLVFSYLGFVTGEIKIGSQTKIDVTLSEDMQLLDEVVVVGYGTVKKATLTGAVVAITDKDIITTKNVDVQNALTGKLAGVKIVQRSSEPGNYDMQFSIRGLGTPLFVIDGVPRDNMSLLDPNEVESISVLKDASAAVYGTRAANGVVLITTKKGSKSQKFRFDYTGYVGTETFLNNNTPLDAIGFMTQLNEQNFNKRIGEADVVPVFGRSMFQPYYDGTRKSSDWYNTFINPHPIETQHNISATGGSEKVTFYAGLGYTEQEGRWADDKTRYRRYNLRSNVTAELTKGLRAEVLLNLTQDNRRYQPEVSERVFRQSWTTYPTSPIYLPDPVTGEENTKYIYKTVDAHPGVSSQQDVGGYNIVLKNLVQTNMALEWDIPGIKGLKAKGMYSFDFEDEDIKQVRKKYIRYDDFYTPIPSADGTILRRDRKKLNSLLQASLTYDNTFLDTHHVSALALYEESSRDADNYWVQRYSVFSTIEELKAGASSGIQGTQDDDNLYTFTNKGLIGKAAYDYLSKYLADFSFRYDGSSKFGPGQQWGFFPVASVGWRPSEEAFIRDNEKLSFITNLKLRGSYGVMGDDSFASYQFLTGYDYPWNNYGTGYAFNDQGISALQPITPNKSFTWVTSKTLDVGLDFELWSGLLGGTADVFRRDRSGFLGKRTSTLPAEAGIGLPYENINSDYAQGFELTLTHRNRIEDLRYNLSAQMAMDRNKIKHYERGTFTNSYDRWQNGFEDRWGYFRGSGDGYTPIKSSIWGYDYLGQYRNMQQIWDSGLIYDGAGNLHMLPGDLIYDDWNGDGVIDGNDEHPIGKTHTALSYGFSIGAEWKGFDVAMVWQGTGHNRRRARDVGYGGDFFALATVADSNGLSAFLDRWRRADEFKADINQQWIPGYYPSNFSGNGRDFITATSNFWFLDATYLRLKTLEVGYTIPGQWTKKIGLQRARLFFNGYNLFTFTEYTVIDPEQTTVYPLVKSFNGGINLTF